MNEGTRGTSAGASFEELDPKLTVFALANGMDLAKGEGYRRLEWFTEGLERGILVTGGATEGFRIGVMSWKTGYAEKRSEADVADGLDVDGVKGRLEDAIERANALGPPE